MTTRSPQTLPRRCRTALGLVLAALAVLALLTPAADAATPPVRGVNLHLWTDDYDRAVLTAELDHAAALGATTVRVDVGWQNLEPARKGELDPWYVDQLDWFVGAAAARGLRVVATLLTTPGWASSGPADAPEREWYPPRNLADYGDVAGWLAARYGARLAALEVWNEPNLCERREAPAVRCAEVPGQSGFFWRTDTRGGPNREAPLYAALVRAAHTRVKEAAPDVPVVAGSLAYADADFLRALYAEDFRGHYDALSLHPYNEERAPDDSGLRRFRKYSLLAGVDWVREVQLAHGDRTPQWLTEVGWSTCEQGRCVSADRQARYLEDAWPLLAARPFVQAGIVYTLRDEGCGRDEYSNWGLLTRGFAAKPAYAALRRAWVGPAVDPAGTLAPPVPAFAFASAAADALLGGGGGGRDGAWLSCLGR